MKYVLVSLFLQDLYHKAMYSVIGQDVCMGDHKVGTCVKAGKVSALVLLPKVTCVPFANLLSVSIVCEFFWNGNDLMKLQQVLDSVQTN